MKNLKTVILISVALSLTAVAGCDAVLGVGKTIDDNKNTLRNSEAITAPLTGGLSVPITEIIIAAGGLLAWLKQKRDTNAAIAAHATLAAGVSAIYSPAEHTAALSDAKTGGATPAQVAAISTAVVGK